MKRTYSIFLLHSRILFLCLSFLTPTSALLAMNSDENSSGSSAVTVSSTQTLPRDFDAGSTWENMHLMVQYRSLWHKERIAQLRDEELNLEERFDIALELHSVTEDQLRSRMRKGLSRHVAEKFMRLNFIELVLADEIFTSLFWDFLDRTLASIVGLPEEAVDEEKAVLPHLARELKNFELYAVGDLKGAEAFPFYKDEFFLGSALLELCQPLAAFYGVEVKKPYELRDTESQSLISEADFNQQALEDPSQFNITVRSEDDKSSNRSPYFMDQLILHKQDLPTSSKGIPQSSDPKFVVFGHYTLPATGPTLLEQLKAPPPQKQEKVVTKGPKPRRVKGKGGRTKKYKPKGSASWKKSRRETEGKRASGPKSQAVLKQSESKSVEICDKSEATDISPSELEGKQKTDASISIPLSSEKSLLPEKKEIQRVTVKPVVHALTPEEYEQGWMMVSSRERNRFTLVSPRTNMRQIAFDIQHRQSTSYSFHGRTFKNPFFAQSLKQIMPGFLKKIKLKLHHSPKTDRLPNLATGFVRFHFRRGTEDSHATFPLNELYCSGGKFFGKEDFDFKDRYCLLTAMQDFLDPEEEDQIYHLPLRQKGIPLGKALEGKLRQKIIGGAWRRNCLDSEALFLLSLNEKLPGMMRSLLGGKKAEDTTITGVVLGISSYRDPCASCQKLIQGFQWNLANRLIRSGKGRIAIDKDFGSLALTFGQIRPDSLLGEEELIFESESACLEGGEHAFVCTRPG